MPNFLSVWHKGILAYGQSPVIVVVVAPHVETIIDSGALAELEQFRDVICD